ncbi:hypothetical protein PPYR_00165 [Photinus pyralis]|uniref:Uncharacterized protein n=1 Tax=Photinus pyralis TaxID=7054 RepID=A0A1Y1KTR0_PHOPY|nr:uncharacterized protein C1orf43 homolog [Photinus pyralis]KAB0803195.1 hypothetical protein PPYR_00165 [Photinus pyralis]
MSAQLKKIVIVRTMSEDLSGVNIIIIIGLGVLTFIILFIFAKRQIMRFALRSRRGPHVPIGHDAKKLIRREIDRRIDLIPRIICEPQLLHNTDSRYILYPGQQIPAHYYRLKAVDDVKLLETEISRQDHCLVRYPNDNLRAYLLTALAAPLNGTGQRIIHQFCDLYDHARHDPNHFGDEEYQAYNRLLLKLLDAAKLLKSFNGSRKSSPNRTPHKVKHHNQEKTRSLDPSRLRPIEDEILCISEHIESRPTSLSLSTHLSDNETSV